MKLQKVEIARQSAGTGSNSLSMPAIIIGTEQATVTNMVSRTLNVRVNTASNLDIVKLFRKLAAEGAPEKSAMGDFIRKQRAGMLKPCW
ncbi:hypothetical protein N7922_24375 [Kosakonia sp. ML.JS2a]|jgi:hypothetical protein|uniref:hypothetical protein n=1 Tax=Kosakonia sp. ML.JS2a TaxID=2980557 RepID=UPI0021D7F3D8|nr:hypothetical protein [Kosakonia sp. ML.JS2a]UXY13490.1 hypothetical protein N7922_24375 [Kosakonia sp. ML.JS2a]